MVPFVISLLSPSSLLTWCFDNAQWHVAHGTFSQFLPEIPFLTFIAWATDFRCQLRHKSFIPNMYEAPTVCLAFSRYSKDTKVDIVATTNHLLGGEDRAVGVHAYLNSM